MLRALLWAVIAAGGLTACENETGPITGSGGTEITPIAPGVGERPAKLVFGLTPYLSAKVMRDEFTPLGDHIAEVVGIPVELQVMASYAEMAQQVASGVVHLAVMSPFTYVRGRRDNPGIVLMATHIADGSSTYSAYIVAREDSGIATVEQLRGKRFGFVDRNSASGYLYPLAYLRSLGHEPDQFFGAVSFAGNHGKAIEQVLAKELDGAAIYSTAYKNAESRHLRILAKTGRIPYDAYCASAALDSALVKQIRKVLLTLSTRDEIGRKILGRFTHINGFVAVGDDHYDEVRRVARLVESAGRTTP